MCLLVDLPFVKTDYLVYSQVIDYSGCGYLGVNRK